MAGHVRFEVRRETGKERWCKSEPGMCRRSLRGNREISRSTVRQAPPVRIGKARSRSR
jgi:hypothetical protein